MRALVIAPQPFFTPRGTPFSVYYRTLVSADLGLDVDLLTYGRGEDVAIPGVRLRRIPRLGLLGDVPVGPSLAKLGLDVVLALWSVALLLRHRYALVHAHEEGVFFCWLLKPLFRFRLVYDMHSSLPRQLEAFDFTRSRLWIGLFRWLEARSLRAADAVICIEPALAVHAREAGAAAERVAVIENSLFEPVKLAKPPPEPERDPALEHALAGRRLVVYAGTLERYQGIGLLLEAFAQTAPEMPDAALLVVGGTPEQVAAHRERARALGVGDRCHFAGRRPQREAQAWSARASVLVSPRQTGTSTPLKVYEQLASGIPLVATRIPAHTAVLSDDVAFLVEPSPEGLAKGLREALGDPERADATATAARAHYAAHYARPRYVSKLRAVLEGLGLAESA